jgi:hypothetical protein
MRPAPVLLTAVLLACTAEQGAAQQAPPARRGGCARTPAEAERQLLQLEDEWREAVNRGNTAFFERVLADEFIATGGASVRAKADYIAGMRDTARVIPSTLRETRVRVYDDVGIVTGMSTSVASPPVHRRYTEVFVCRAGRWRAVHGHYNRIQAAPAGAGTTTGRAGDDAATRGPARE